MKLYNTATKKIEEFTPLAPPSVTLYTCGPTVYDYPHVGNLRSFVNNDLLKRTLLYFGYKIVHTMNITDVGHLTGDDDSGEDKMEKGAKKTGKSAEEIASYYTSIFTDNTTQLNILPPNTIKKATECISDMIDLIKKLEQKGVTYETDEAVYFNTSRVLAYGKLSGQNIKDKIVQARDDVYNDSQKKHPADFALWFKRVKRFKNHSQHWNSPWGDGFPGWHIECSAIALTTLAETIDIHAGGIEHIPVHHENEIAQSETATSKPFVRYWFHNNHLKMNGKKMSKSLDNYMTLSDIITQGHPPLALRYLFLQTHYRKEMNLTTDSLLAATQSYKKLISTITQLRESQKARHILSEDKLEKIQKFSQEFREALSDDMQIPRALAVLWDMLKSNITSEDKLDLALDFDTVLGLEIKSAHIESVPPDIEILAKKREDARRSGNFTLADDLRKQIEIKGYTIRDTTEGVIIAKYY